MTKDSSMYRKLALAAVTALAAQMQARGDVLRSAQNFAVLGASTVTSTGATTINGNVGVWTGTTAPGFGPGTVVRGAMHLGTGVANQAQHDVTTAYNALAGMTPNQVLTGTDLGGMTLTPGVYFFGSSAALTGTLTLNGMGNPNAKFVFQVSSTLTAAGSSVVSTINGADGLNVYWVVGSSATLGTSAVFKGNILALASITLNTGASIVDGRALART